MATDCTLDGSPAAALAALPAGVTFRVEHPSGAAEVVIERDGTGRVIRTGTVRTARLLMDDTVHPAPNRASV